MDLKTDKKVLFCAGLILIIALGVFFLGVYNPPVKNHTVTVDGISFNAPDTSNYTNDEVVTPKGSRIYIYTDEEHNLSVSVSDSVIPGMDYEYKYDTVAEAFTRQTSLGGKFVGIEAERSDDLDMVLESLRVVD